MPMPVFASSGRERRRLVGDNVGDGGTVGHRIVAANDRLGENNVVGERGTGLLVCNYVIILPIALGDHGRGGQIYA